MKVIFIHLLKCHETKTIKEQRKQRTALQQADQWEKTEFRNELKQI